MVFYYVCVLLCFWICSFLRVSMLAFAYFFCLFSIGLYIYVCVCAYILYYFSTKILLENKISMIIWQ